MPSDTTNHLYEKLGRIAMDVEQALSSQDFQGIESLLVDHQMIMSQLSQIESPNDLAMGPVIKEAEKNVMSLISKIKDMQNDIKIQLSAMNKKKLIQSAYHA